MKHIIVIGFMGSGKSTISKELAKKLHRPLYDTDESVVDKSGMSIAKLISTQGEDYFRNLELTCLKELLERKPGIIATGGGIINTQERRNVLRHANAHIIWLKTDFETSSQRVLRDSKNVRPLFHDSKKAEALFYERQELYKSVSSITVDANQKIADVTQAIIDQLPKKCYIIGDPVSHSFSPYLHNKVYARLGLGDRFQFEAHRVETTKLASAVEHIRALDVRGVSVTIPHKIAITQYLDRIDPIAKKIGAVNTVVNENGSLIGYNTDADGVLLPLLSRTKTNNLKNKHILIIGTGGAAKAAAFVCADASGIIYVANRTFIKAESLAHSVNGKAIRIDYAKAHIADFEIVINATSVGMGTENNSDSPLPGVSFLPGQIVFDAVYTPHETQLLRDARRSGASTVYGLEMLGTQAIGQIKRYTGHDVNLETVMDILKEKLHV